MSILHQLRTDRIKSEKPVVKVVDKGEGFKMIGIALAENVVLKDHKTNLVSKLVIIEGAVEYKENTRSFILHQFDEIDIPVNEVHALVAKKDALCLLIQKTNG